MDGMAEGATRILAEFLAELSFADLPDHVVEHTKRIVLDFAGVAIAGSTLENSRLLAATVREWGGPPEATVIAFPFKLPAPAAGLLNGAIGHAIQMDDTEWSTVAHLGTEVIPASLALTEKVGNRSGKDFITAVVAGYEGAIRIGMAVNPSHHQRGFSPNGTLGVFGAAIGAGKVLNLSADQMADAIGSAAMQSSGLEEFCYDGSMSAILNTGHATHAGVVSAILAQRGFTGSRTILEGKSGFCRAYSDDCDLSRITTNLGERFGILDVWFKSYPTCAYCNSALDVVMDLRRNHGISAEEVEQVIVKTFPTVEATVNNPAPENFTAAMLSMPYSVAMALREGRVTPREFEGERWTDDEVRGLMRRVSVVVAEEELLRAGLALDRGAMVKIICRDGKQYEGRASAPKGDPMFPFSDDDVLAKYKQLASEVFDASRIEAIAGVVRRLDQVDDAVRLADLLRLS